MNGNTNLPAFELAKITVDGDTLKIERNKDTKKSAQELSTYIHALNLTAEQNNRLIALIIEQVQDAKRGAFAAGLLAAENVDGYTDPSGGHGTPADSFPQ